jgi:hypothetical protein
MTVDAESSEKTVEQADRSDELAENSSETLTSLLAAVLWDGVIGAIAGLAGNVAIVGTLALITPLGGFSAEQFAFTAEMLMLQLVLTPQQLVWVGFVLFVGGGLTVWPLLLATLGSFLPGEGYAKKGLFFGAIMWTGFVFAFYGGYSGIEFALYLLGSFLGHVGYGFTTGAAMDRLFAEEGRPVITASLAAPSAGTEPSANPNVESTGVGDEESWDQSSGSEASVASTDEEPAGDDD